MKSLAELRALRDKERAILGVREGHHMDGTTSVIVGMGTSGINAGARTVLNTLVQAVADFGLYKNVIVMQNGGISNGTKEPVVMVKGADGTVTIYNDIDKDKAMEIAEKHLKGGTAVTEYTK